MKYIWVHFINTDVQSSCTIFLQPHWLDVGCKECQWELLKDIQHTGVFIFSLRSFYYAIICYGTKQILCNKDFQVANSVNRILYFTRITTSTSFSRFTRITSFTLSTDLPVSPESPAQLKYRIRRVYYVWFKSEKLDKWKIKRRWDDNASFSSQSGFSIESGKSTWDRILLLSQQEGGFFST